MAGYYYQVRMRTGADSGSWHTRVPVRRRELLPGGEIERRARNIAVQAFGEQAAGWTLIDAERQAR